MKESTSLQHVAVIMDGNGRWANDRRHSRIWGHVQGSLVVEKIVQEARNCLVNALTLYAFSTENRQRPFEENRVIFKLLKKYLLKEKKRIMENNIRFRIMGNLSDLPRSTRDLIGELEDKTQQNSGLKLTFAFGYSGQDEIVWAANKFIREHPGVLLTRETFSRSLMLPDLGDVDLLIRTGGDQRISNFLLWQSAYAELYFTPTPWPDFTPDEFRHIYREVKKRERCFGNIRRRPRRSMEERRVYDP